jgi:multiple antibiotic resistance protein
LEKGASGFFCGGRACWVGSLFAVLGPSASAQIEDECAVSLPGLNARKIFFMLFLMIGPVKILVPLVNMTRDTEAAFRRRLATRAILFSAAADVLTIGGSPTR